MRFRVTNCQSLDIENVTSTLGGQAAGVDPSCDGHGDRQLAMRNDRSSEAVTSEARNCVGAILTVSNL